MMAAAATINRRASSWQQTNRSLGRCVRFYTSSKNFVNLEKATLYGFGIPTSEPSSSLFRDVTWNVPINPKHVWGVVGPRSSSFVDAALLGRSRSDPVQGRNWPILSPEQQVEDVIKKVTFKTRLEASSSAGSGFSDYTSRYFGIRQEDATTLREHLQGYMSNDSFDLNELATKLDLVDLLDLPLITLSNGQTRRARIARALLTKPRLLVLEEPFTGLDIASRQSISSLLINLHHKLDPAVVLTLRPQDGIPDWITHVVQTNESNKLVYLGSRKDWSPPVVEQKVQSQGNNLGKANKDAHEVISLDDINVTYGDRRVLKNISMTIRHGDRWALKGHNGSGKTTLLALILGDHPFSYTENVKLFGRPRDKVSTYELNQKIGHLSPELFNSFPRRHGPQGLTAREVIGTGFDHVFTYRKLTPEQKQKLNELVESFDHPALSRPGFLDTIFAELSTNDQTLILLLRALVKEPELLVLDEPFSGMDKETTEIARLYLDTRLKDNQAMIVISHFEDELPESTNRVLRLDHGDAIEYI